MKFIKWTNDDDVVSVRMYASFIPENTDLISTSIKLGLLGWH
jgi:hypothetical protein